MLNLQRGTRELHWRPLAWAEMRLVVARIIWKYILSMTDAKCFCWEDLGHMMVVEKEPLWLTMGERHY